MTFLSNYPSGGGIMNVQISAIDQERGRIRLPSSFDSSSISGYRSPFARLLSQGGNARLVVDFSGLTYIDSVGIATLITWERLSKERGKDLVLEGCSKPVIDALKLLGVYRMFSYH